MEAVGRRDGSTAEMAVGDVTVVLSFGMARRRCLLFVVVLFPLVQLQIKHFRYSYDIFMERLGCACADYAAANISWRPRSRV